MKHLGILSFFPALQPASSGGEQRLHGLASRLARRFSVEMIAPTFGEAAEEEVVHGPRFTEHRFPKTAIYRHWQGVFRRAGFGEASALAVAMACRDHKAMRTRARQLAIDADILVHDGPFMAPLAPRRGHDRQLLVYNAYNVEADLARDLFPATPFGWRARLHIERLERRLVREADLILAVSDGDASRFRELHGADPTKIVIVPNGVPLDKVIPATPADRLEARRRLDLAPSEPVCLFIGSHYPTNCEAADYVALRLAPALPRIRFVIAGSVCEALRRERQLPNVRLAGAVTEDQKRLLLQAADIAINPMFGGSGTNVKMLEYFAAGLPTVTTPHGARGLLLEHRRQAHVVPEDGFLRSVEELAASAALRAEVASAARAHVERHFVLESIADRLADLYELKTSPRVMILNDYAVTPADTGGRKRIEAEARALAAEGIGVSIITLTGEDTSQRTTLGPRIEELNIARSGLHRRIDMLLAHALQSPADDVSALLLAPTLAPCLVDAIRREARMSHVVVFSHCYLESLRAVLPRHMRVFYDSHNVEHELKAALLKPSWLARRLVARVRQAEQSLARDAEGVFCVSANNRDALAAMAPESANGMVVIPNGADIDRAPALAAAERRRARLAVGLGEEFTAIFIGSAHPPNIEAVRVIIEHAAPRNPDVCFLIVGTVCTWLANQPLPHNVVPMKSVSDAVKDHLLALCDLGLNPMETGSGTSLKLFDYLAAGLPVLTTRIGARGVAEDESQSLLLAERDEFAGRIAELASAPELLEHLRGLARRTAAERYDWRGILKPLVAAIAGSASAATAPAPLPDDAPHGAAAAARTIL